MITLYERKQKRHRYIEQNFGLCGRGRGWDDLGELHWNKYNIIYETNCQSRFDAWYRMLGAGALGWPREMVWEGGGRRVQDGEHVYTHGWFISMYVKTTAAAAAKSLQSCPTLRPHRLQPTRLPSPQDSPDNNTGVGCHFLLQCMKVTIEVAQSCPTLSDPMDCSPPGSSMGFSRQEHWSGWPFPSPMHESEKWKWSRSVVSNS